MYSQQGTVSGTATGTLKINMDGTQEQLYDWEGPAGFAPATRAIGTMTVDPDCRGTSTFHDVGYPEPVVHQTIVIAEGGREIWGIFQDPTMAVGTFKAKRITAPRD
jgi:hypothetical protein